jgi:hypothetical protein
MRTLSAPPASVVDPSGRPLAGSWRGPLPAVDLAPLGRGRLFLAFRRKRWLWLAVATDDLLLGAAVVDLGYLGNSFAWALDRRGNRLLADRSALGPPPCVRVGDTAEEGCAAAFRMPGASARLVRPAGSTAYEADLAFRGLSVRARLETQGAPPPIAAVAAFPDGRFDATEKRALLRATGEAVVGGRSWPLDGALAGFDYTHGVLPRRTAWRWAFALGRARSGERVAFNLVEGFVGDAECGLWIDDELLPLAEGRFEFDRDHVLAPWRVRTADRAVDLGFEAGGAHAERKNFGVVASRFVQVAGAFRGRIAVPGRAPLDLDGVAGVAEDQDMLW